MTHSASYSDNWEFADWKGFQKVLFRLQKRIFKAIREGDKAKAKSLQKLVLSSYAARMLAIRQVTQLNTGKKTAGIDGKKSLTFKERFQLEKTLKQNTKTWKHQGLREIPIPKKDGNKRILKIPTIADRAWQCLLKYALEPAHEATFHANSYGFRPGRSTHDAQKMLFLKLKSNSNGINKRILEIDIAKCFDRINHKAILDRVIAPDYIIGGLRRCLKSGVDPKFPEQGTPQGGVCSPLLANIALNGIEKIGEWLERPSRSPISKCLRYADDMVFILKPEDSAEQILDKVEEFLAERGMEVSQKKTKVTASTDGFDFLGWHFYVQKKNGKFRSIPSEDNFKAFRQKVKHIVNNSNYGAETKVSKLAPVVRGWRNYHKYCKMDGSRFSLWYINQKAFKVFLKQKTVSCYKAEKMIRNAFPNVSYSENKFVNVKGEKSPFDGDINYWAKRNSKYYDGATAKTLRKQNHSCGHCGLKFLNGEKVELHHIDDNHNNWDNSNLLAIHRSCHHYVHMGKGRKDQRYSGAQCDESRTLRSN
ncbi:RNA-directed DNA polymerase (Reverse transcriptase) [Hyella patelloides LEGE 07179]|uniref:RNA-directed DNA polymerase (Reverse transcriptase) n=1 Tax=Hyella patelloides LEGE 07179 TaxID=945734 RepID=A0A563VSW8_9CYAN|nr:reverse transcriptase domain-containing protein [Hyella patelloides]VEP14562.1 RNA-directed DNA polymerase (Reverse transcriptase) [Hyella patelloides LEGE 07179]